MNRLLVAVVMPSAVSLLVLAPAAARADTPPTLHVVGLGVAYVTPDLASVTLDVDKTGGTRSQARAKTDTVARGLVTRLINVGIPRTDIQTGSISLSSNTQIVHKKKRTSYEADTELNVTVRQIGLLPAVFGAATIGGADYFDGPNFAFSNPTAGQTAAAGAALTDARARADAAAAQVGYHVVGISSIDLDPSYSQTGVVGAPTASAAAAPTSKRSARSVPAVILPGQQEVDATVGVVYTLASN